MKFEIERKFLVNKASWKKVKKPKGKLYQQGYLLIKPDKTIRVRTDGKKAYLTIKGKSEGAKRSEFEYPIPVGDAVSLMETFRIPKIIKTRFEITYKGKKWEVDEFSGENEGLFMAEIELEYEDEKFDKPGWAGKEVTGDIRYYNSYLAKKPYRKW